jgi:transcriptional regulator with XRE-family HTH domain
MKKPRLGARIRSIREAHGLTLSDAARAADMPRQHLHRLETGGRKSPRIDTILRVARALGVTLEELAG